MITEERGNGGLRWVAMKMVKTPYRVCVCMRVCVCACIQSFSHVRLFATSWTIACQAPLSMGFFRQEYRSGLSFPPPGDLPDPGIKPASLMSPALQVDSIPLSLGEAEQEEET